MTAPTNGSQLASATRRDIRIGFITALWIVGLLFALSYGLRALGVGAANRSRTQATSAAIDSMRADVDTLKALLRALPR